jgi:hypothetical protein
MLRHRRALLFWLTAGATAAGLGGTPVRAQDPGDGYLDAIRQEVRELDGGGGPAGTGGSPVRASEPAPPPGAEPADASQAAFEADLRQAFPGSYILYRKLSDQNKAQVLDGYRETGNLATVRERILELLRTQ